MGRWDSSSRICSHWCIQNKHVVNERRLEKKADTGIRGRLKTNAEIPGKISLPRRPGSQQGQAMSRRAKANAEIGKSQTGQARTRSSEEWHFWGADSPLPVGEKNITEKRFDLKKITSRNRAANSKIGKLTAQLLVIGSAIVGDVSNGWCLQWCLLLVFLGGAGGRGSLLNVISYSKCLPKKKNARSKG